MTSTSPAAREWRLTPARAIILAIGVPASLALVVLTAYGIVDAVSHGSYTDSYTVPVTGSRLTLNLGGGDATVNGGTASGSARLSGTVSYDLVRPDISPVYSDTHSASGTTIDLSCPPASCGLQGMVGVPARTAVSVSTNGGNATLSGLAAPVYASTGGGNVSVASLTAGASLSTDFGNVTATAVSGGLTVQTGGGNINGDQIAGNLDLDSQGGYVNMTSLSGPDATVSSGGGNVDLAFAVAPKTLSVNTSGGFTGPPGVSSGLPGGNITIELPPGSTGYHIEINNLEGGTVSSTVTNDPAGKNLIIIDSDGGNVTIS